MPETYWKAASRILRVRINDFARMCRRTASRATPDNIHDLRVSTRRLAAAQDVFDLDALADLKRTATRIRRKLGDLRDLDVSIKNLGKLAARVENGDEVASYLRSLKAQRARMLKALRPMLRLSIVRVPLVVPDRPGDLFIAEARPYLMPLLDRAGKLLGALHAPDNARAVHAMRIWVKRLRYRLELFTPAIDERAETWVSLCKKMQDQLGEIHDRDVLIGMLEQEWTQRLERKGNATGIGCLLEEVWRDRHRLNGILEEQSAPAFPDEIRQCLLHSAEPSSEPI